MKKLYNIVKNYCVALYKAGSQTLDFIDANDKEYSFIFANEEQRIECSKVLLTKYNKPIQKHNYIMPFEIDTLHIWSYQYHYAFNGEHYGNIVKEYDFNVLEHKDEYFKVLKDFYIKNKERYNKDKRFYHILIGLYILLNNSYDLTNEQKENVKLLHDLKGNNEIKMFLKEHFEGDAYE